MDLLERSRKYFESSMISLLQVGKDLLGTSGFSRRDLKADQTGELNLFLNICLESKKKNPVYLILSVNDI